MRVSSARVARRGAQDAEDVGLELAPVVVEVEVGEAAGHPEPRVGDDDVEPAELGDGGRDRLFEVAVAGHVARDRERARPGAGEFVGERRDPVDAAREQGHRRPLPGELAGERRPDPGRSAGDERHLSGETRHRSPF